MVRELTWAQFPACTPSAADFLCDLGQVTYSLCLSSQSVKQGKSTFLSQRGVMRVNTVKKDC